MKPLSRSACVGGVGGAGVLGASRNFMVSVSLSICPRCHASRSLDSSNRSLNWRFSASNVAKSASWLGCLSVSWEVSTGVLGTSWLDVLGDEPKTRKSSEVSTVPFGFLETSPLETFLYSVLRPILRRLAASVMEISIGVSAVVYGCLEIVYKCLSWSLRGTLARQKIFPHTSSWLQIPWGLGQRPKATDRKLDAPAPAQKTLSSDER